MKKRLTVLSLLIICAAFVASASTAYFTAEKQTHNIITSGGVKIELNETTKNSDGTYGPFPVAGISEVMPGMSASKVVVVKNTGKSETWIRVFINTVIVDEASTEVNGTDAHMPVTLSVNGEQIDAVSFRTNENDWIYSADDCCYYYKEPVPPGVSTAVLFDEVRFAEKLGNEYEKCKVLIGITAEAVQTANNRIPDGGEVRDVFGRHEA